MATEFPRIWRVQSKARNLGIALLAFTAICLLITSSSQGFPSLAHPVALQSTNERTDALQSTPRINPSEFTPDINTLQSTTSKYAYATLFTEGTETEEDDKYLTCTRMLTYQLLHDPATRTEKSIPFVVLVPPTVSQAKRNRLQTEGATVVEVPTITFPWMKPGRPRWAHVMNKLNIFKLIQFEKILLLDSDVIIFQRLDSIFSSPETQILSNLSNSSKIKPDEGPQPQHYLMAGDTAPIDGAKHKHPATRRSGPLNAGFLVIHPSEEMYEHNLRIASIEGRFSSAAPEQNLWNYIHRPEGNMPWTRLEEGWIMNSPNFEDYQRGVKAVHEKWFRKSYEDEELKRVLRERREVMEDFWARGSLRG